MPASIPASMVNQMYADLGIPNRFNLISSRFRLQVWLELELKRDGVPFSDGMVMVAGTPYAPQAMYRGLYQGESHAAVTKK